MSCSWIWMSLQGLILTRLGHSYVYSSFLAAFRFLSVSFALFLLCLWKRAQKQFIRNQKSPQRLMMIWGLTVIANIRKIRDNAARVSTEIKKCQQSRGMRLSLLALFKSFYYLERQSAAFWYKKRLMLLLGVFSNSSWKILMRDTCA